MAKLSPSERAQDAAVRQAFLDLERAARAYEIAASIGVDAFHTLARTADNARTLATANPRCIEPDLGHTQRLAAAEIGRHHGATDDRHMPPGANEFSEAHKATEPLSDHYRKLAKSVFVLP